MLDILGHFVFEMLLTPLEWMIERLWRVHRKEPAWRRWIGGSVLSVVTVILGIAYLLLLVAIPFAGYLLVRELA
jgi:hypothetical protein